ncbi:unnamed protein product [Allacma fusca]|uniref:TOG domain-containing protein n=1 Tax=Allacma fusca TaxID=39272 RepID=A0A8J2L280_9HEXA|nr:unnamed protein product [Allacma fusca]
MSSLPRNRGVAPRPDLAASMSGSVDLKSVLREVEPLPGSSMFSAKEVDEIMQSTAKIVGDNNTDWIIRLNALKKFRSLCADPEHHAQIVAFLRHLAPPLQAAVKDLRSQIGREACLSVAYIAVQLGIKCEFFIEPLIPTMFSLLVANAKVVTITGSGTISIIYEYVPSWRLIPPLQAQMNSSKSKEVRRAICSVLKIILTHWPHSTIQKQAMPFHDIMKKGLGDADADARTMAREAFPLFQQSHPGLAQSILDSLEPLQKRQLMASISQNSSTLPKNTSLHRPNGSANPPTTTATPSLSRQGSMKRTNIPVLASRASPVKAATPAGRSTSAIDLQAAHRAKQQHFSTMRSSPLRYMGRTNSMAAPASSANNYSVYNNSASGNNVLSTPVASKVNSAAPNNNERSRNRSRISRLSQSQPGSRSNSPSSKFAYQTYNSPYSQTDGSPMSLTSPPGIRGIRRFSATSSASSSRDTSPTGRMKLRSRSVSQSPQTLVANSNSTTAKMLLASREAEFALADAVTRGMSEMDFGSGNHSDSEDSMTSHRSFLSETTFSPPNSGRHLFHEDNVEELLNKCGSAKWSERKEGLLGLQAYLQRHGSLPPQYFNRIGQTFCRIFMDAHTKVLSLFLDVLHAVLYRHAKDLVDFTTILLNRILTKLGSDLLTSVHTKLMKTLEIIMDEMPPDTQFSAVAHYLCDPTQTPNSRSRIAALCHLYNLSTLSVNVKVEELQQLVEKILDWCGDQRSHELRRVSQKVFYALFDMAAPQMTIVLGQMAPHKQDQAKAILKNHVTQEPPVKGPDGDRVDGNAERMVWNSINSDIQSLKIQQVENDLVSIVTQLATAPPVQKSQLVSQLHAALKDADDAKLVEHHKEVLKVVFDSLTDTSKPGDKAHCFGCLEELCNRPALASHLAAFAELFIVRVTDVQTPQMPRDVTKAAENCGMSLAASFPPEILTRALCPIVQNREFPVNQVAIKMLQRMCESCDIAKLRALVPDIITTLIDAYDHPDSAVRKAAVFAIVAIYIRLGSDLQPYLSKLSGSKLKLLQLYIQRAQQQSSSHNNSS